MDALHAMIEIERRFLCRVIDDEALRCGPSSRIRQGYLTDGDPAVRIRELDDEYILTIKTGRGIVRREVEVSTPPAQGRELMEIAGEHRAEKIRYRLGRWEIDLFEGKLSGLVLAEIELTRVDEALPPVPAGIELVREVTSERVFTNQRLAALGAEEARHLVEDLGI
jgi:CYTH domain-containing protein